jgi:hypothetical protein
MDDRNVEPVTSDLYSKARVQLRSLRRVFSEGGIFGNKRQTVAVKGLSLAMYEGQITGNLPSSVVRLLSLKIGDGDLQS